MKFLRHKVTGLTGFYPAHFSDTYPETFEDADSSTDFCVDCVVSLPEVPDENDNEENNVYKYEGEDED